jgi:uncharacterized protein with ParB-like and HNH nuclease domain
MTTFDSTKTELGKLLEEVVEGKIQLPDFQRGWVWDTDDDEVFDGVITAEQAGAG